MSTQLSLLQYPPVPWTYYRGEPDRSGPCRYTHLIRSRVFDPPETMGRGHKVRDPLHWKKVANIEVLKEQIINLMKDGKTRTFNHICIELTGTTADIWYDKSPDKALWSLVRDNTLAWAQMVGAIFFIDSNFVNWD